MAIQPYLAVTAAEIQENKGIGENLAWMACHFSPYGRGLSNFPTWLSKGSLLMLDDITPIQGHDPERIAQQLMEWTDRMGCAGILLDFQREGYEESQALAQYLSQALSCPVGVAEGYAAGLDSAVFLPPVPCHMPLKEYLKHWKGREIWLEMALDGMVLTVREKGTEIVSLPWPDLTEQGFVEESLHCHYKIQEQKDAVVFTLWRTREDLDGLLEEAEKLGVARTVGLYQEFRTEHIL